MLTVAYGKPIEVSEYFDLYKVSPERALNELRSRLSDEMKGIMVHIESEEDYEAIDELRSMINGRFSDDIRFPKLFRDRILVNKMNLLKTSDPALYTKICSLSLDIKKKAKDLKTDYRLLEKRKHPIGWLIAGMIGIILTFPLFIYGNIFNLTFLEIPNLQIRKIKDPQFHSSIRYGISLALAFVFLPALSYSFAFYFFLLVAGITYFSYAAPFWSLCLELLPPVQKNNRRIQNKKSY